MRRRVVGIAGGSITEVPHESAGHKVGGGVGKTERIAVGGGCYREVHRASWRATGHRRASPSAQAQATRTGAAHAGAINQRQDVGGGGAAIDVRHNHLIITGLVGEIGGRIGSHIYPKPLPLVTERRAALRGVQRGTRPAGAQGVVGWC